MTVKELVRALESLNPNADITCYMPDEDDDHAVSVPVMQLVVDMEGEVLIEGLPPSMFKVEAPKNAS